MKYLILPALLIISACATKSNVKHDDSHHQYKPKFSKLGKGEVHSFAPGYSMISHVGAEDLPVGVSLSEIILQPKSIGAPPHMHSDEDEIFVVLEGVVHFLNDDTEVVAKKGTVASMPRGYFHGFWNPTNSPAKMALIIAPGHFEKFFYAVEKAVKENRHKSPKEIGKIITELAKQRNVTMDMSKLPASGKKLLPPSRTD